jgi:hypothetical protein
MSSFGAGTPTTRRLRDACDDLQRLCARNNSLAILALGDLEHTIARLQEIERKSGSASRTSTRVSRRGSARGAGVPSSSRDSARSARASPNSRPSYTEAAGRPSGRSASTSQGGRNSNSGQDRRYAHDREVSARYDDVASVAASGASLQAHMDSLFPSEHSVVMEDMDRLSVTDSQAAEPRTSSLAGRAPPRSHAGHAGGIPEELLDNSVEHAMESVSALSETAPVLSQQQQAVLHHKLLDETLNDPKPSPDPVAKAEFLNHKSLVESDALAQTYPQTQSASASSSATFARFRYAQASPEQQDALQAKFAKQQAYRRELEEQMRARDQEHDQQKRSTRTRYV